MMQDSREHIIEVMRERGISVVNLVSSLEEFAKENGFDNIEDAESEYHDYISNDAPWVIFFNKWGHGIDYAAKSVELGDGEHPRFKLNCYNDEEGDETFHDDELTVLSMVNVYDRIVEKLEIEKPGKVWVMTQESNVDGEISFNVLVCKDEATARKEMNEEKEWIRNECYHFKDYDPNDEDLIIDEDDYGFYIEDDCDDYYEDIRIFEKEII